MIEINNYKEVSESKYIIYSYIEIATDEVVYIGVDSNGHYKKRHTSHLSPSLKERQKINKILQDNPEKYSYKVICICADEDEMLDIEASLIMGLRSVGQAKYNIDSELKGD